MSPQRGYIVGAVATVLVAGLVGFAHLAVASGAAPPTTKVIVLLKDQLPGMTDRVKRHTSAMGEQQSVLSGLPGGNPGAVTHFSVSNAFTANVTSAQSSALAGDPAVAAVVPNESIPVTAPNAQPIGTAGPGGTCPSDPATPMLEPEALGLIHAKSDDGSASAQDVVDGSGVKVGFIADGLDANNPDFVRPGGQHVITDYQDFSGEGTAPTDATGEAFGDASAIAAQGVVTHDLHAYDPSAVPSGCAVRIVGVAPGASVVALKAGSATGFPLSSILQAIDYAVNVAHVDVLNESLGEYQFPDAGSRNAVQLFNDAAIAAGVTVVASSGDAGVTNTIATPASDPQVISVGATTELRLYAQLGVAKKWADNNIAEFSSGGFTNEGNGIDLVAPGNASWADCSPGFDIQKAVGCVNKAGQPTDAISFAGTSESAPLTSGTAALVIEGYRKAHAGLSPSPALVKRLITGTSTDLGQEPQEQGAGLLDSRAAVQAAMAYHAVSATVTASDLVPSTSQLDLTGTPGSTRTAAVTVTDAGSTPLTVMPSLRHYVAQSTTSRQVTLPSTTPIHLTVPSGTDLLHVRIANQRIGDPFPPGPATFQLLAPDGTLENLSAAQGMSGYSTLSVAHPVAGTWTVAPSTTSTGATTIQTQLDDAAPVGEVGGPLTVPPGGSRVITVRVPTPSASGDDADALVLASSNGKTTTVPVLIRTLVPISSGGGHFSGTITGGNGRPGSPDQMFTYAFDVPPGEPSLHVSTTIASSTPDYTEGLLIDPHGETPSVTTNGDLQTQQPSMGLTVDRPVPGRWRFVFASESVSKDIGQDFAGTISFTPTVTTTSGLPRLAALPAGTPTTVPVTVTNHGTVPLSVGIDARSTNLRQLQLTPLTQDLTDTLHPTLKSTSATVPLPNATPVDFLVPPDTRQITGTSIGTQATQVDLKSPSGGIDVVGDLSRAQAGAATSVATVTEPTPTVTPGPWLVLPQQIGPFGPSGAPSGSATLGATVLTQDFDPTLTSPDATDQYLQGVDPKAAAPKFVTIAAGATATIPVTITPNGPSGTQVSGVLNLVTPSHPLLPVILLNGPGGAVPGDVVATVPYTYTVR